MSTHLTSEATRQLKEKVSGRFQELQATGGVSAVASSVGMKVVNLLRSDMAKTVPPQQARKALIALGFRGEELSECLTLHTIARSPVGGPQSPMRDLRKSARFHWYQRVRAHAPCRRQSASSRGR